ncbi:lipopolysaccharide biosynthesis protein [Chryseobacterium indoltheticum]|uniref:Lipopolysaccharide biosynthesis protein n=1 Tax=Chryseobacterium indoltheticum TaxID=254 RepID=A0A3G6NCV2_9FLAO|nr:lipopolysaccharide biosynthesis protein [Chryseobacterium indoltheticum]AZA62753.1 lipopolysaccharide biosynthesis protein [Chryseobacterium indoltheticum]
MKNRKLLVDSAWSIGSHVFSLVIVLGANIFLARLMGPKEFGQLGIIMFFIAVFNVFTDGGLSGALVRRLDKKEEDYSTVFAFNFIVSIILFLIMITISGLIAQFYNTPSIQKPIIAAAAILIISSFQTIQNVKMLQKLEFKKRSMITLLSTFLGVIVGIGLAFFLKLGIWALIAIPISTVLFQTILYIYLEGFYFNLGFNKSSFKELFGFGVNTTLVSVLNLTFDNIYQLVIGRVFNMYQVGFYYQAKKLQDVPNNVINNLSQGVFFSSLSRIQNQKEELIRTYNLISKSFLFVMGFAVLIMQLFGKDMILLMFGSKWLGAVYYIKLLIIGSLFYTQELINKMIFKVYNKTNNLLRLEFVKKIFQIITLVIGVYLKRIDLLLYGYIATNAFSYFINYYFTSKIIEIGKRELILLIKVIILLFVLIVGYRLIETNITSQLLLKGGAVLFVISYIIFSEIFNIFSIKVLINLIKKNLKK